MVVKRASLSAWGCFLLGLLVAGAAFGIAAGDLFVPAFRYPQAGSPTSVTYRVPAPGIVQELDERSITWRGRFELPIGQRVSPRDLSLLRALEADRRPPSLGFILGLAAFLLGVCVTASHAIRLFIRNGSFVRVQLAMFLPLLLLLGAAKAVFLLTPFSVYWIPLAALSIPWAILHSRLAGVVVGLTGALVAAVLFPLDWGLAVTLAAQAVVPPLLMDPIRKRRSPGLSWLGGAFAGVVAYVAFHFVTQGLLPAEDLGDLRRSGLLATLGAAAVSPLLAYLLRPILGAMLGVVSPRRLMDLADLDHPLLKQLASEAPGTWQHSLSVANLAEVVCSALGINALLTRVGAYYHDVGKSLNPSCFAENLEPGQRSPHVGLPPEESAGVIFEHVTAGLALARQHRIPFAVREFVSTHHGHGLLEFFWHACQEQGNPRGLPEDAFHYPGIPPQTQEAAVLAICDAIEAASRTLKDPDDEQLDGLVQRILLGKLKAGQLGEAGLSAGDLATIALTLRDTLRSQFHVRPEYPWQRQERDRRRETPGTAPGAPVEAHGGGPSPMDSAVVSRPLREAPAAGDPAPAETLPPDTIREPRDP